MPLTLPNLDDRRWADLVDEARSLIPVHGPEWTDHNVHDPGVMLVELFAWIAETNVYRLNQIPERSRRKFLALLGVQLAPPRPSAAILSLTLKPGASPVTLPAGLEFEGSDTSSHPVRFRTVRGTTVVPGQIRAVQSSAGGRFKDLTARWQRGEAVPIFGEEAAPGAAIYLGFTDPPPDGAALTLAFAVADAERSAGERRRLSDESARAAAACRPRPALLTCDDDGRVPESSAPTDAEPLVHHSVRAAWEYVDAAGGWRALPRDRVADHTRSFTLNGAVELRPAESLRKGRIGEVDEELHYLRCRVVSGAYEQAPWLRGLAMNGVALEQAYDAGLLSWQIPPSAVVEGTAPVAGDRAGFRVRLNEHAQATHITFGGASLPSFYVLDFTAPSADTPGVLAIAAHRLGSGTGDGGQEYRLSAAPVVPHGFRVLTLEDDAWVEWSARPDFDASRPGDPHVVLDAQSGVVRFGDGRHGRVPPLGALVLAAGDTTRAGLGNIDRDRVNRVVDSPRNRALLARAGVGTVQAVSDAMAGIRNPLRAAGGEAAEALEHAEARALELARRGHQAVTAADYEAIALDVPGTRVARASARPNLHPSFPCLTAPGIVTVMIVPELPRRRPVPSDGLRRVVAAYLARRSVIGTRVEVVGPSYVEISVRAAVQPLPHVSGADLRDRLIAALDVFLDPLRGGPDGTGWPFGRDVYRSEILHVLDTTPGVDYVSALAILRDGGPAQCGNVCLGPDGLTTPGIHSIEIAGGARCVARDRSR